MSIKINHEARSVRSWPSLDRRRKEDFDLKEGSGERVEPA